MFLLGPRGSGKTTTGEWLAKKLGIFHIQFREQVQMLIMAKTKRRIPYADEADSAEESPDDLEALIKEARGEDEEMKDTSASMNDMEVNSMNFLCGRISNIMLPKNMMNYDVLTVNDCVFTAGSGTD